MNLNSSFGSIKNLILILILLPIFLLSLIFAVSWFIEYEAQCGLSLSYYCGTDKSVKAALFATIAGVSGTYIKNAWKKLRTSD